MENNGKTAIKWVATFGAIVLVVGGLIALSVVIVNNGVSTEDALGGTSRYVRSDVSSDNSVNNEFESSDEEKALDKPTVDVESSVSLSDAYDELGEGYDDVDREAVVKDENGNIYIYDVLKSEWDNSSDLVKARYKVFYYNKSIDNEDSVSNSVNSASIYLSCGLSPYRDAMEGAKYEASISKDKYGLEFTVVTFTFSDGSTLKAIMDGEDFAVVSQMREFSYKEISFFRFFNLKRVKNGDDGSYRLSI